ncbi:putative type I restriction-modification system, S subunit [Mycoplasma haemofelis Ohio2]|uniref:Putative type I restriction-modification system, S subunit n=1 Tax=Mycoplasma haemofelis (strain Ohio2) TaxID=859194 RepID=F6FIK3_MYCHI|nr:putative type I restriction-modification system, S subunit [Mycoplasma haemofelis Ohio2]
MSIQADIASKLGKFQELKEELKEELLLRKKKHNYYRRQIWKTHLNGVQGLKL